MNAVHVKRHDFAPDHNATDRPGGRPACIICGLPEQNRAHAEVPVDDSDRIVGEAAKDGG